MNTYLITGASGCIGFETAKWLLKHCPNDKVISLSRGVTKFPENLAGMVNEFGDILDSQKMTEVIQKHRISHIIHCAGLRTSECQEKLELAKKINVDGTMNLFLAGKNSGTVKDFTFISTAAVYDQVHKRTKEVNETSPVAGYNAYVATKLQAEVELKLAAKNTPIAVTILRPQIIFGPTRALSGSTAGVTIAIQQSAFQNDYTIPFSGNYSFHFSGDCGQLISNVLLAEKKYSYEIFNLPGTSYHLEEFIAALKILNQDQSKISLENKLYPFAQSLSHQKFTDYFAEPFLTPLDEAIAQTFHHFLKFKI